MLILCRCLSIWFVLLATSVSAAPATFPDVLSTIALHISDDLARGTFKSFDRLAVRSVTVTDGVPEAYGRYVETLVIEQIRARTQVKLINCEACRSRVAHEVDGHLAVAMVRTSLRELDEAARVLNIDYFLDVILIGETTHVSVSLQVISARTKEQLWAQVYDRESEEDHNLRASRQMKDIAKARTADHYIPDYTVWYGFGYAGLPNVAGGEADSQAYTLQLRLTEQVLDQRAQFGIIGGLYVTAATIAKPYPVTKGTGDDSEPDEIVTTKNVPKPFSTALMVGGMYYHTLYGDPRRRNSVRGGINVAIGGLVATGYATRFTRVAADLYLGPRGAVSSGLMYLGPTRIQTGTDEYFQTTGGLGADVVLAFYL